MAQYLLTYLVTTRNKLAMLQENLLRVVQHRLPDEEILVVDGASTDGTPQYLEALHRDGKIQQWISEPDRGEAHGWNKGMLRASGDIIKIITDDDVYLPAALTVMKRFMLRRPDIDALIGDGATFHYPQFVIHRNCFRENYDKWLREPQAIGGPCLGLTIRRSSIPLLGLFNTSFHAVDAEYLPRATSSPSEWAFYTGISHVGVPNERSGQRRMVREMACDVERVIRMYELQPRRSLLDWCKQTFHLLRSGAHGFLGPGLGPAPRPEDFPPVADIYSDVVVFCHRWLEQEFAANCGEFLTRKATISAAEL